MDFESLYAHYRKTGNPEPLLALAPKDESWGHTTPPHHPELTPRGVELLALLADAYEGIRPLSGKYEWADWHTLPR